MIQQDVILHEKTQTVYFMRNAIYFMYSKSKAKLISKKYLQFSSEWGKKGVWLVYNIERNSSFILQVSTIN